MLSLLPLQVWDLFQEAGGVKGQLVEKIKVESLRTYLFSYSSVYDSISLEKLATMYELPRDTVHSVISKIYEVVRVIETYPVDATDNDS